MKLPEVIYVGLAESHRTGRPIVIGASTSLAVVEDRIRESKSAMKVLKRSHFLKFFYKRDTSDSLPKEDAIYVIEKFIPEEESITVE